MLMRMVWMVGNKNLFCIRKYVKISRQLSATTKSRFKKTSHRELAVQHFDNFYGNVYRYKWPSIRLALQCPSRYCAFINSFAETEDAEEILKTKGALELHQIYRRNALEQLLQKSTETATTDIIDEDATISDSEQIGDQLEKAEHVSDFETNSNVYSVDSGNINEGVFVPATKLKYEEEIIDETEYYSFYRSDVDIPVNSEVEKDFDFPEHWKIFVYPRGSITKFPAPKRDSLNLYSYYLMDGSSILPILALNPQPGEIIGDLCAAPGGKALAILFSLRFGSIVCNDVSKSRINRLVSVLDQYIPSLDALKSRFAITNKDARELVHRNYYDKILLDVPCTNDRLSVNEDDNNIFKTGRNKERIQLPQLQLQILCSGLKALKQGGSLVYSTCSLSPIQNDGVVHMALCQLWQEKGYEFVIRDLSEVFKPLNGLMKFWNRCKYGQLVIPFLPLNHGPMYICKVVRVK